MDKELQDKIIMVRVYMGDVGMYYNSDHIFNWNDQIKVWAKLCKDKILEVKSLDEAFTFRITYFAAICNDKPQDGFEIICQIIEQINKQP